MSVRLWLAPALLRGVVTLRLQQDFAERPARPTSTPGSRRPTPDGAPSMDGGGGQNDGGGPAGDAGSDGGPRMDGGGPTDAGPDGSGDGAVDSGPDTGFEHCPPVEPERIGSAAEPRKLTRSQLPLQETIDWRGLAFIQITGLSQSKNYTVTLSGSDQLTLIVYSNASPFTSALCVTHPEQGAYAACPAPASTSIINLAIDAQSANEYFSVHVHELGEPVGQPNAPVQLAASTLPRQVEITPHNGSYYEITGLAPGQQYLIGAYDEYEQLTLTVHDAPSWNVYGDVQVSHNAEVIGTPSGTTLFLTIRSTRIGATALLYIEASDFVSEGASDAPIIVHETALPLTGEIAAAPSVGPLPAAESFYAITGLTPGAYYVVVQADSDVSIAGYDTADWESEPRCLATVPLTDPTRVDEDTEDRLRPAACASPATDLSQVSNDGGGGSPLRSRSSPLNFSRRARRASRCRCGSWTRRSRPASKLSCRATTRSPGSRLMRAIAWRSTT